MNFFSSIRLRGKKLLIAIGIFLFLVVAGAYAAGQLLTQAEVLIKVNAKQEEKDFVAKVVLGGTYDTASSQIPGTELKESAQGSQKAVATGSKKTGTKAKGEIKVLNWDKNPKTFSSGTEVITPDGLKFAIDNEIQVASRSATTPGESKVNVTAADIGPKYNIASGVDLTIVGFDEVFYSATVSVAPTGGDEKQSTVVSAEDLTRLEKSQADSLTQKAKQGLKDKNPSFKIDEGTLTTKVIKKDFDKKQDEEASLVNLNMEVEVATIAYNEEDLKKLLSEIASQASSQDLEARGENIEIANLATTRTKDVLNLKGKERIGFTPKINEADLAVKIAGKSVKETRRVIMEIKSVSDVQVKFSPSFLFADTIPRNKAKIKFKIET